VIQEAYLVFSSSLPATKAGYNVESHDFSVDTRNGEEWKLDEQDQFFLMYGGDVTYSKISHTYHPHLFEVTFIESPGKPPREFESRVSIAIRTNAEDVQKAFGVFERYYASYLSQKSISERVVVFVGHGHDPQWRDLKDHLHEKHGFKVVAYEVGARGGIGVNEVLNGMADEASIAFLVHTAENADASGLLHPRDNVIHETGLFQGRLGARRAIVLLEDGCEKFSNIQGLTWIPFRHGNIAEIYGDVLATIKREFGAS
jgi:hypothetical protein